MSLGPNYVNANVTSSLTQTLLFGSMTYRSALSELEETRLVLRCDDDSIEPGQLAQQLLIVAFDTPVSDGARQRHFSGHVAECYAGDLSDGYTGRYATYTAILRPWLWFLTLQTDFKIYQGKTTETIVREVFAKYKNAKFDFRLTGQHYPEWTYCTQMFESDFDFVARLLAHEGIYWYFEHAAGGHELILVDSLSTHEASSDYASVRFYAGDSAKLSAPEYVNQCVFGKRVRPTAAAFSSYDFENPATTLSADARDAASATPYEIFDYHGKSVVTQTSSAANTSRLQDLSLVRLQEFQSDAEVIRGEGNVVGLELGRLFALDKHWRSSSSAQYLLTAVEVAASARVGESASDDDAADSFICRFSAMPANRQFRPARRPKPVAKGPVSALVVGPAGEEIFTDKYGRVKLQFHCDRHGSNDATSSCWVRVSQSGAGANFGAIQIPRIGNEVIVDFLDGDVDQPIVVGGVYNAQRMPPWTLPDNATQSGMLSRSSKAGSYAKANALRMDDKAGAEELWLHAERQLLLEVEKDELHTVGGDRTTKVEGNQTLTVKLNRSETVTQDSTTEIDGHQTLTVKKSSTETITQDATTTIQGKRSVTVSQGDTLSAQTVAIKAANSLSLTCGAASITLNSDGSISIKGTSISINGTTISIKGSAQVSVQASGVLALKGAQVTNN
jgi:type VI secretion system secreted protein VgrG